jgi:hypothetical protein
MAEKAKPRGGAKARGSKTEKPKAAKQREAARETAPGIGHNGGVPDEVYLRYLPKIATASVALEKAKKVYDQRKGELRQIFGAAKEDGCNIDAIRRARDLNDQDLATVAMDYADTGRVLRLMRSPLATQLDLFADIERPAPVNAFVAGQRAGLQAVDAEENPHKPGSEEFVQWAEGWADGQATNGEKFKEAQAAPLN